VVIENPDGIANNVTVSPHYVIATTQCSPMVLTVIDGPARATWSENLRQAGQMMCMSGSWSVHRRTSSFVRADSLRIMWDRSNVAIQVQLSSDSWRVVMSA